jgi:excisionase family DNA binding protein
MSAQESITPPRFEDLPELTTVEEVAAYLRISRNKAYELVQSKAIPSVRFGRLIRVPKSALLGDGAK